MPGEWLQSEPHGQSLPGPGTAAPVTQLAWTLVAGAGGVPRVAGWVLYTVLYIRVVGVLSLLLY